MNKLSLAVAITVLSSGAFAADHNDFQNVESTADIKVFQAQLNNSDLVGVEIGYEKRFDNVWYLELEGSKSSASSSDLDADAYSLSAGGGLVIPLENRHNALFTVGGGYGLSNVDFEKGANVDQDGFYANLGFETELSTPELELHLDATQVLYDRDDSGYEYASSYSAELVYLGMEHINLTLGAEMSDVQFDDDLIYSAGVQFRY